MRSIRGQYTGWGYRERVITVFPDDPQEIPHDCETYEEAVEYGDEMYGYGNYTIQEE